MTREEALDVLIVKADKGDFVKDIINQIYDEHEAKLKAKDEEIANLGELVQAYLIPSRNYEAEIRAERKKTRSIVAALFWEWRKAIRVADENTLYVDRYSDADYWYLRAKEEAFKQAHQMLKDTK